MASKTNSIHFNLRQYRIHEYRTQNTNYAHEVSEVTDRMRHSQQEYNEQVAFKLEFFEKTIGHKNILIDDLEGTLRRAKKELAE